MKRRVEAGTKPQNLVENQKETQEDREERVIQKFGASLLPKLGFSI